MKTADLVERALLTGKPLANISADLGLNANALAVAKHKGRLSPAVAAALAAYLGEPVARWTLAAVMEGERSAPLRRRLKALASNLYFCRYPRRYARTLANACRRSAVLTLRPSTPSRLPTSA